MSNSTDESRPVAITCVIPVFNAATALEKSLATWLETLHRLDHEFEILIVDDGSTDTTAEVATTFTTRLPHVRLLTHATRQGYGACLRSALPEAKHLLFFHTRADESYPASDIKKLIERIEVKDEFLGQTPVLVSGCRTGQPKPWLIRGLGSAWRLFCRVVLGLPLVASPAWLGVRETAYGYFVWAIFGVPLHDPNSAFKLWRTDFLRRFPIQSDGNFVHVELVAKATFLTQVLDEIPLTPQKSPSVAVHSVRADLFRVLRDPDFGRPSQQAVAAS